MAAHTSTALITGGTSGIGRAVATKLAQLGIHIIVVGRNVERGEQTVADIRAAGGTADFLAADLRDASSARDVARRAVELGNGQIDILINNAGIYPFQTVPTPPLLWWGVRATLPCKPRLNEEPRCENEKASLRTLHIRT